MYPTIRAATAAVALLICGSAEPAPAMAAGKPIFSDMTAENDPAVAQVRDRLTEFAQARGHWPTDLAELVGYARAGGRPIDLSAFAETRYSVEERDGASVALFEFTAADRVAKGAFAVVIHTVP